MDDGYRVFPAENAKAALSCIERNKDAAVLLADSDMPGWKGLIRSARHAAPNINVIAMLSSNTLADTADLRRRGVGAWFFKPIVYDDIRRAITTR